MQFVWKIRVCGNLSLKAGKVVGPFELHFLLEESEQGILRGGVVVQEILPLKGEKWATGAQIRRESKERPKGQRKLICWGRGGKRSRWGEEFLGEGEMGKTRDAIRFSFYVGVL